MFSGATHQQSFVPLLDRVRQQNCGVLYLRFCTSSARSCYYLLLPFSFPTLSHSKFQAGKFAFFFKAIFA